MNSNEEKIYIVTAGRYSSYGIEGVFDSREKAQVFLTTFFSKDDTADLEEWYLNLCIEELANGLKPCFIRISRDGATSDFRWETDGAYGFRSTCLSQGKDVNGRYWFYLLAKDEAHAIKMAGEKRAQLIATGS